MQRAWKQVYEEVQWAVTKLLSRDVPYPDENGYFVSAHLDDTYAMYGRFIFGLDDLLPVETWLWFLNNCQGRDFFYRGSQWRLQLRNEPKPNWT